MFRILFLISTLVFFSGCTSTPEPESDLGGWVRLTFDIDTKGVPQNIVVTESEPENIFDKEAIRALSKWKYKPKFVDGQPVIQKDQKVQLDFRLEDDS